MLGFKLNHVDKRGYRWWLRWRASYDSLFLFRKKPLHLRHNERHGVSNRQHIDLFDHWFRRISKKTSKLCVNSLFAGNSPVTGEFPAQRASNTGNFPFDDVIMAPWNIRQHGISLIYGRCTKRNRLSQVHYAIRPNAIKCTYRSILFLERRTDEKISDFICCYLYPYSKFNPRKKITYIFCSII